MHPAPRPACQAGPGLTLESESSRWQSRYALYLAGFQPEDPITRAEGEAMLLSSTLVCTVSTFCLAVGGPTVAREQATYAERLGWPNR